MNGRSANAAESGFGLLRAVGRAQEVARAPLLGQRTTAPQRARSRRRPRAARGAARATPATGRRGPRNGHTSGRSSAAAKPSTNASRAAAVEVALDRPQARTRRAGPRSCRARSCARTRRLSSSATRGDAARRPAARRAARRAGRPSRCASSPPARAITSHRSGAASSPNSANGVVKSTGSGFHDGPAGRAEVEVGDLAAPDDPRPRVVGRARRAEQRQRREAEAGEHEQPPGRARRAAARPSGAGARR